MLVVFSACILYLPALGTRDIWAPEEGYYALEAKEMLERGDWLVPHVNGEPRLQKPVLYHWLVLVSGSVNETTARIPSALSAILTVLVTLVFAVKWFGLRTGIISAIILSTTTLFLWHARYAGTDMLLVLFVCASCFTLREALIPSKKKRKPEISPRRRMVFLIIGFALAGFAVLSKGPVGALLPALTVALSLFWKRNASAPPRPAFLYGAIALLVIAVPWYIFAIHRAGQGFELVIRQNFLRFLSPWDHEGRSWCFYLFRLPLDLFPWSLFIPAVFAYFIKREKPGPQERFLICWLAVVTLFFLISGSRQGKYFLPMYPAFAILVARSVAGLLHAGEEKSPSWWIKWALIAFAALAFLFAAFYPAIVSAAVNRYPRETLIVASGAKWALVPALVFGIGVTMCIILSRGRPAILMIAGFMITAYFAALAGLMPALDIFKSPRRIAEAVLKQSTPETRLAVLGKLQPGVSYYSGRRFEWLPVDGGETGRKSAARCRVFLAEPGSRIVLMPERHLGLIRDKNGELPPGVKTVYRERLGSRILLLLRKESGETSEPK
jgi:4-amino-4-deoxy-L-arabinose transferase-like glycosyltransferase